MGAGKHQTGATYLAVLFMVATLGILMAVVGSSWSFLQQREKERALLKIGQEFRRAITAYHDKSPGTVKRFPLSLNELLDDKRFLGTTRHLRRVYTDPLTGKVEWGLIQAPEGGIMGVYSLAKGVPIKKRGFRVRDVGFEGAQRYAEWRFVYQSKVMDLHP